MEFHNGEIEVQERAGVRAAARDVGDGILEFIVPGAKDFLERRQIAVIGSIDESANVWASVVTGEPGFIQVIDPRTIMITPRPFAGDPLFTNLAKEGHVALLAPDFATARRLRVNGRALVDDWKIFIRTEQVYGNCRRYIQQRVFTGVRPDPQSGQERPQRRSALSVAEQQQIARADTFFFATDHPQHGADISHKGGKPGFVRIIDPRHIAFPDYNGNSMFNTLGNVTVNPRAGLLFIDFESGRTLQFTGLVSIDWDPERARSFVGAERVIDYEISEAIDNPAGFPLLSELRRLSQFNP